MNEATEFVRELRKELKSLSDGNYREFNLRLCNTSRFEMLGVRVPQLRQIAKRIITEGECEKVFSLKPRYYEEAMIKALVTAGERIPFEMKIPHIEALIDDIDNWAVCDTFCSTLKPKKQELDSVLSFCEKHIKSDREYEIRLAAVIMLDCLIDDGHIDRVLELLTEADCGYYYTSMAVAWALSVCYVKYRGKTAETLRSSNLDEMTLRRTVRKICDSYRVNAADKTAATELYRQITGGNLIGR